jgi:hypothetical protein
MEHLVVERQHAGATRDTIPSVCGSKSPKLVFAGQQQVCHCRGKNNGFQQFFRHDGHELKPDMRQACPLLNSRLRCLISAQEIDHLSSIHIFWVRSCLYVESDSVHICREPVSIFQDILRAKSDAGALMQFDR